MQASITDSTKSVEITTKNGYIIQSSEFRNDSNTGSHNSTAYAAMLDNERSQRSGTEKSIQLSDVAYGWGNGKLTRMPLRPRCISLE